MNVHAKQMTSIHVNHMDITTSLSFFTQIKNIIVARGVVAAALGVVWTNYDTKLAAFNAAYAQARKAEETEDIKNLDGERDKSLSAFLAALKAMLTSPNQAKQAAAKKLMFTREKYHLDSGDEYMKQTTAEDQYIQEVEASAELMACLATAGLEDWFQDMKDKNNAFLAKMNERTAAMAGLEKGIVRATRIETEAAYADLVKLMNALSIVEYPADVDYSSAIDLLNSEIDHFLKILARKGVSGGSSSGTGSSSNSGSTNSGNSGTTEPGGTEQGGGTGTVTPDPGTGGDNGGSGTTDPETPDNPGGGSEID